MWGMWEAALAVLQKKMVLEVVHSFREGAVSSHMEKMEQLYS